LLIKIKQLLILKIETYPKVAEFQGNVLNLDIDEQFGFYKIQI
jgi:hypothetical protein